MYRQREDYPPCPRPHHYRLPDGRHFIDREGQARDRARRAAVQSQHAHSSGTDDHAIVIPRTEPEDGFTQFAQSTGLLDHLPQDAEGNHLVAIEGEQEALGKETIEGMNRQTEEALKLDEQEVQSCQHHLFYSHLNNLPPGADGAAVAEALRRDKEDARDCPRHLCLSHVDNQTSGSDTSTVDGAGSSFHNFRARRAGNDAAADIPPNGHTHTSPPSHTSDARGQLTEEDDAVPRLTRSREHVLQHSTRELSHQHKITMSELTT